jgi:putative ABC transport system permease protein
MTLFETLRTALESLASNKLRTLLTMLGVIIGVASVITLLAIGAGVSNSIQSQFSNLGAKLITVSNNNRIARARLTMDDVLALSDPLLAPDLARVVPAVTGNARASAGGNNRNTQVSGTTLSFFVLRAITLAEGELFTQSDADNRVRVAVLGGGIAETLFPGGGAVGQTILIDTTPVRVIGVAVKQGGFGPNNSDDSIYVPLSVAQEKLFVRRDGGVRAISQIYIEMVDANRSTQAAEQITAVLRKQHKLLAGQEDDFRIFNQAQIVDTLNSVVTALTAFLGAIGAISLLVGGIGIMNIMLVSVTERTREIGVRKAIGARDGTIRFQFLIEALVVTCLAGIIGILVGTGLSFLIGSVQTSLTPQVQWSSVAIAFGVSALIGIAFGFYPAWRASRLQPVEALRYE